MTNAKATEEQQMPRLTSEYKDYGDGHSYRMYDTEKLMAWKPYCFRYRNRFGIKFYEHPVQGGDYPVLAVLNGICWNCEFYDPWNDCDQGYIIQQAVQIGLLPADTILWEGLGREEMARDLRAGKMEIFHTHDTFEGLQNYIDKYTGEEKAIATIIMGITMNTTLEVMAQRVLENGK